MRRFVLLMLSLPIMAHALDYRVALSAPDTVNTLLREHLDLFTLQQDEALSSLDLDNIVSGTAAEVRSLLETEGYFASEVKITRSGNVVTLSVTPGEPVIVMDVDVNLQGAVRQEEDFSKFLSEVMENWALPDGAVFRQDDWDTSKKAALRPFLRQRFPQARITLSKVEIDPGTHGAKVRLTLDSGPKVRFGDIRIEGMSRYPEQVVRNMADFSADSPYTQDSVLALQAALESDSHFSSVVVAPLWEAMQDNVVPVGVKVVEQKRQKFDLGLNFSTGDGFGSRIGYEHYNLFKRGYTGSVAYDWKRDRQKLDFGLGFPRNGQGYSHSVNLQQRHIEDHLTVVDASELGVFRIRQRGNIESRLGAEYLIEREQISGENMRNNKALVLSFGWVQRAVESGLRPTSGYLLEGHVSGAAGGLASDTRFMRVFSRAAYYWSPTFMRGTWLTRLEGGQVWAQETTEVPASRLFKAGGVNSVRGYDFQSLGVRNPDSGAITGGRVLATGTLEYQYPVAKDWRLAAFMDAGDAADSWQSFRLARAQGVGVRWLSPIAPLAFDMAYGARDQRWRWNLNLGLAF